MKKILLLVTLVVFLNAQRIKSIEYNGLSYISPVIATQISGLKIGEELTGLNSNKAILKLYEQGYFEDIKIENFDGKVVISVTEKPTIAKIELTGIITNDKDQITKILGIRVGQIYNEYVIKNAKERIKQFYEVKGYLDTVIKVDIKDLNKNAKELNFIVNRGENIKIQKVNLVGAKKLKYSDIEPAIANKQREFLGWMWGFNDGKLKVDELKNDSARIRDEYMKRGYLDANVSEPFLNAYMDSYKAELTYYIEEGEIYRIDKISVKVPEFVGVSEKEILKELKLKSGDKANSAKIRKDIANIQNIIADKGYAYAEVNPATFKHKNKNYVDIVFNIIPHSKVYINDLRISGNEKTSDRVVRREMYLTEGNLYNKTDLDDSLNSLKRTGYFDDVQIKENLISNELMNLDINVTEAATGSITGGIGYGSSDGLLLNAGISDSNIFGSGMTGSINVEKSDDTISGSISLVNPRINDGPYSLGGSIFALDNEWNDYKEKGYGFNTTLGRKLGRFTTASLTYQISKIDIEGLNIFYAAAGYQNGKVLKSSITPAISFNNTDDFYVPRHGIIASTALEYSGLGGDVKYAKSNTKFNFYQTLEDAINLDVIFRYKAGFNYMWNTAGKDKIPVNDKLFIGGLTTIRGFDSRSIPRNTKCIKGVGCRLIETGGMMSFNNSAELSFPLINRVKMRFVTFYDYGMIGENSLNEEYRHSTGAGIEWITPIGPLQIFYVKPLNKKINDDTTNIEFMIGRRF